MGSINSNPGSTVSRGSKANQIGSGNQNNFYVNSSPPNYAKQLGKNMTGSKNSTGKNFKKLPANQYTMYQPASVNLPLTSQQSRRKSQVSVNNAQQMSIEPHMNNVINFH